MYSFLNLSNKCELRLLLKPNKYFLHSCSGREFHNFGLLFGTISKKRLLLLQAKHPCPNTQYIRCTFLKQMCITWSQSHVWSMSDKSSLDITCTNVLGSDCCYVIPEESLLIFKSVCIIQKTLPPIKKDLHPPNEDNQYVGKSSVLLTCKTT